MLYASGVLQWLTTDALNSTQTVSGLAFQPKALRFDWQGLQSAVDANSAAVNEQRGVGFAVSTSSRRAVATRQANGAGTSDSGAFAANDCIVGTVDGTGARDGELDLDLITSDGFRVIVDDVTPQNISIFWQAWGGDDITVAVVGDIAEPAATGNQDYTATGFVSGATDQVVMFAGVQSTAAVNSGASTDSGFHVGFATSGTAADNVTVTGNSDDASNAMDTDGYCKTGECLSQVVVAGGTTVNARAQLTQFGTDNFRLNWIAQALTNRRSIFMAIKGGKWKAGAYTIAGNSAAATATVSGLNFPPIGILLIGRMTAEQAAGTSTANDRIGIGMGTSTSSRQSMGILDEDATASGNAEVDTTIQYDQVLSFPSTAGALQSAYDINAMNSDGFQIIVDTAGGVASEWQGYLAWGIWPQPNVSDSVTTTESVNVSVVTAPPAPNVSDTITTTESVSVTVNPLTMLVSDDDAASESVSVAIPMSVVVSDVDSATESISVVVNPINFLVSDTDNPSEAISIVVNPINFLVSDTDNPTEEINVPFGQPYASDGVSDSVIADEFVSILLSTPPVSLSVFDTETTTENVTVQIPMQAVVFDDDIATESVTVRISMAVIVFDDDVATDAVAVTVNPLTLSVFDTDAASESVNVVPSMSVVVFDTDAATEFVDIQRSPLLVTVSDDDLATDVVTVAIPMSVAVVDTDVATETVTVAIPMHVVVFDDDLATEAVSVTVNPLTLSVVDTDTVTDEVTVQISIMVPVVDIETVTELVTFTLNPVLVSVIDDDVASESVAVVVNPITVFVSDADTPTEDVLVTTGQVALVSASDTITITELVSVVLNPVIVDVSETDAATEFVQVAMLLQVAVFDADAAAEQVTVEIAVLLEVSVFDTVTSTDAVVTTINPLIVSVSDDAPGTDAVEVRKPQTLQVSDDLLEPAEVVNILLSGLGGPLEVDVFDADSISERRLVLSIPVPALHVGNARIRESRIANQTVVL